MSWLTNIPLVRVMYCENASFQFPVTANDAKEEDEPAGEREAEPEHADRGRRAPLGAGRGRPQGRRRHVREPPQQHLRRGRGCRSRWWWWWRRQEGCWRRGAKLEFCQRGKEFATTATAPRAVRDAEPLAERVRHGLRPVGRLLTWM